MALTYWTVLSTTRNALAGLNALAAVDIKIRPEVSFLRDAGDAFPIVLVCPRRGEWESIPEGELYMTADGQGGAMVGYPVLVAVLIQNRFDQGQLQFQLNARDEIRRHLWEQRRFRGALPTAWNVGYNPSPKGIELSSLINPLDVSIQEFFISTTEARSNG